MRFAAWPVYIAFVGAACRAEVILDDGRPDGSGGKAASDGGVAGRGVGGAYGRGGNGAGGNGRGGAAGSGTQEEGGLGSGGVAGTGQDDDASTGAAGMDASTDDATAEGSVPPWPGPPPYFPDGGPDGCVSTGPFDGGPNITQCQHLSTRYDAARKSVVLEVGWNAPPGVGGTYALTYTLGTPSGARYGSSSGPITMVNGWMVLDLSAATDIDKYPIIHIGVCSITYTDVCGATQRYSETHWIELYGCQRLDLLPLPDAGVDLFPVCGGGGCGSRCAEEALAPSL